ncbi:MAG: hypothetical protein PHI53_02895 [Candidatus Pacebacteria bacterium]|nr:hypothetical protein [Candidatus Paceibacterota bacterium]
MKNKKRYISSKDEIGFTLAELLVVVFIIILLLTILVSGYKSGQESLLLDGAVYKLAQDARRIQATAGLTQISCKKFSGEFHEDYSYSSGIYFNSSKPNEYILFADCDGNKDYSSSQDETIETKYLDKGIKIKSLKINSGSYPSLSVVFTPPDPFVFMNGASGDSEIIICLESNELKIKTVTVNKAGLISTN